MTPSAPKEDMEVKTMVQPTKTTQVPVVTMSKEEVKQFLATLLKENSTAVSQATSTPVPVSVKETEVMSSNSSSSLVITHSGAVQPPQVASASHPVERQGSNSRTARSRSRKRKAQPEQKSSAQNSKSGLGRSEAVKENSQVSSSRQGELRQVNNPVQYSWIESANGTPVRIRALDSQPYIESGLSVFSTEEQCRIAVKQKGSLKQSVLSTSSSKMSSGPAAPAAPGSDSARVSNSIPTLSPSFQHI